MTTRTNVLRKIGIGIAAAASVVIFGDSIVNAQTRDPFAKPGWARTRDKAPVRPGTGSAKSGPAEVANLGAPPIEQRIAFYKQLREAAVANAQELPKVTSVLTLNEMAVTGIFRTPRGLAAMVEAIPIKLSYTIYPGEKFFDGQLVAVEENQLIFRRVTKMSNGKFVSSVENKLLRQYTDSQQIQGTAPTQTATASASGAQVPAPVPATLSIVSPLDEMNQQATEPAEKAAPASRKRPTRVAARP